MNEIPPPYTYLTHSSNKVNESFYPKISVIVPCYNVEKYVENCLNSIISQTYSNLEIIVVDDGATDCTGSILDVYAEKDNRIIVIHKPNGGMSSARNAGLDISTGDYVSFIDGDDFIDKDLYHTLVPFFYEYPNTDLIQFGYNNYNEEYFEDCIKDRNLKISILNGYDSLHQYSNASTLQIVVWNKLYKKSLLENIRFYNGKHYEDGPFVLEVLFYVTKSIIVENKFYHYRKNRPGSITSQLTNSIFDEWDIISKLKDKYKKDPYLINCIDNYSIENAMYRFVDILNRGGENKKTMLKSIINHSRKLRSTKLICPFGIKYIRYKIFLWFPYLFLTANRFLRILKKII